ncbi:Major facilitator, sugar transporter-like [Dillenia turbinata]|uniref:Major facilitator, sugar transporter-like n=1 Tax=Dillenia turbinata TaxID=194707 RepID=A0AAN8URS3_9MAGN
MVKENISIDEEGASQTTSPLLVKVRNPYEVAAIGDGSGGGAATVGYSSPAQSGIMKDMGLSVADYSLFGSILTIGAMVGAIVSGKIADFFGRRGTMWLAQIFCSSGWLAIVFSVASWSLDLGRLSIGCGIGVLSYVVPIYIAEITPKNLRGAFTTLMICCGVSITYLIGTIVTWRTLAIIGSIPCVLQIIGLFFVPESPRWLAKVGRGKDCEAALQQLRGKTADVSDELSEIKEFTETLKQLSDSRVLDLFQWKYAHSLVVGVGLMVLQQFGGVNGIVFYANAIFESAGLSGRVGTTAMVIVQLPMTLLGTILMDVSGRRPLLMISAAGTCLGCLLVGLSFLMQDLQHWAELTPILSLVGVLVYSGSFSLGMGGIPWVIMSEIFPINIKGLAGSLVTLVSWLGSWIVSYAFNFLMGWKAFLIFSSICGFTVVFVAKLVPETKGRTLEEIQASMNKFSKS